MSRRYNQINKKKGRNDKERKKGVMSLSFIERYKEEE
jgi:hypothetical protein